MCAEVQTETAVLCLELLCMNFLLLRKSHLSITLKSMGIHFGPPLHGRGGVQHHLTHEIPEYRNQT
jgi:hypothetical protein